LRSGRGRGPGHAIRFVLAPVTVADDHVTPDGQAARGEDQLHVLLVHAGRAGEHPGARVPGARHLQQALERAVLAVCAMQQWQHHVDLAEAVRHIARGRDHEAARAGSRRAAISVPGAAMASTDGSSPP
jgi:hypothetical protein